MRKIILHMHTTLDGFIAGPNGEFDAFQPSDEELEFSNELFRSAGAILLGRVVYEGFVSYWDPLDPEDPRVSKPDADFARIFKSLTRVVFSRTLERVEGNTILIKDNINVAIRRLKEQRGRDLVLVCGPELLSTLLALGLIDELRIIVRPGVLGSGKHLFGATQRRLALKLISTKAFASGAVLHHYEIR